MNNWITKLNKRQEGIAFAMALLLMLVGGLLIVPASMMINTAMNANRVIDNTDKEIYAADTGIEYALWKFQYDGDLVLPDEGEQSSLPFSQIINDKEVDITIANEGEDGYKITSTAIDNVGQSTTVVAYVEMTGGNGSSPSGPFDHAITSVDGDITLSGNVDVYDSDDTMNGNIHANGNISMSGNANVAGDGSATGTVSMTANADIEGDIIEGDEWLEIPFVDVDGYKAEASAILEPVCVDITRGGNWSPSPGVYPDPEHVDGRLRLSGIGSWIFSDRICVGLSGDQDLKASGIVSATFEHTVKVGGDLDLSTSGLIIFQDTVWIRGDLKIASNTSAIFEGPVYVEGDINLSGNATVVFQQVVHVIGDLKLSGNNVLMLGATIYVEGELKMSGNSRLEGGQVLVVDGDIQLTGNSKLNIGDIPFLISTAVDGDVKLAGNDFSSVILYAPDSPVTMTGNSKVFGCVVGKSVDGGGNNAVEYPTNLMDERDDLPGGGDTGGGDGLIIKSYSFQ